MMVCSQDLHDVSVWCDLDDNINFVARVVVQMTSISTLGYCKSPEP